MLFACCWPIFVLVWSWNEHGASRAALLLDAAVVIYFLFLSRWDIVPYFTRAAAVAAVLLLGERGWGVAGAAGGRAVMVGIGIVLWYPPREEAATVGFPLCGGAYVAVQAGRSRLTNYHGVAPPQRFALDLVKLNRAGARAAGLHPSRLAAYAIFGASVVSPCDGVVREAVDGLPDLKPGDRDPRHPGGNHVLIQAEEAGLRIHLSHLMQGSVQVRVGERVARGQALGRVGNSGNTTEPHLHIHAVRSSDVGITAIAVPLRFDGRWLIRNSLYWSAGHRRQ